LLLLVLASFSITITSVQALYAKENNLLYFLTNLGGGDFELRKTSLKSGRNNSDFGKTRPSFGERLCNPCKNVPWIWGIKFRLRKNIPQFWGKILPPMQKRALVLRHKIPNSEKRAPELGEDFATPAKTCPGFGA